MAAPKPNPNSAVNPQLKKAAVALTNHACTLGMQHIQDGMLRLQFNREIAYYAQGIVRDVERGRKSVEEGLKALEDERSGLKKPGTLFNKVLAWLQAYSKLQAVSRCVVALTV